MLKNLLIAPGVSPRAPLALTSSLKSSNLSVRVAAASLKFVRINNIININNTHQIRSLSVNHKRLASIASSHTVETSAKPPQRLHPLFTNEQVQEVRDARLKSLGPYISKLPVRWIPYAELMRLDKPAGTWYLFLPSAWAILIAGFELTAPVSQVAYIMAIFGVGSLLMRGAGCTINDILDRKFDKQVLRTIERPLASGRVTKKNAYKFLMGQLTIGAGILAMLPANCFILGASSLTLVLTYPLFKRFTYYPQVVLSACFKWGCLLGFAAMGDWNWSLMLPLYFACFNWCMIYDTIYAHQDKLFDVQAGVKSTALAWGKNTKPICYSLAALQVSSLALMGTLGALGPGFWITGAIFSARVFSMIKNTNLDSMDSCWKAFNYNVNSAKIFTVGIFIDYILRLIGWW